MIERSELVSLVEKLFEDKGKKIDPEFNQIGFRNPADRKKDIFNDLFGLWLPSKKEFYVYPGTTDPGKNAVEQKEGGAAFLCEGAYEDMWVLDTHAADIKAFAHLGFCQRPKYGCKPVKIWRDRNRNFTEDDNTYESRNDIGLNKHRASANRDVPVIGDYSWACQVALTRADHEREVMFAQQTQAYKKDRWRRFGYLLVLESEAREKGIILP